MQSVSKLRSFKILGHFHLVVVITATLTGFAFAPHQHVGLGLYDTKCLQPLYSTPLISTKMLIHPVVCTSDAML